MLKMTKNWNIFGVLVENDVVGNHTRAISKTNKTFFLILQTTKKLQKLPTQFNVKKNCVYLKAQNL